MNKKLIALAVAGAVGTPLLAQAAEGDVRVYGRINTAVSLTEIDRDEGYDDGKTDLTNIASRLGVRYDKNVGNGLGVHGRYEFKTDTDGRSGITGGRIATVGVSGGFGRVDVGNQWSAYFNTFGTLVSPTYSMGAMVYATIGGGAFRSSNTIKYSNTFGPVSLQLDVRLRDDGSDSNVDGLNGSGFGVGATFSPLDALTVGAAYDSENNNDLADTTTERFGVAAAYDFGIVRASAGYQRFDDERSSAGGQSSYFVYLNGSLGEQTSWLLGYSEGEGVGVGEGGDSGPSEVDSDQVIWGIYHKPGGGLTLYYEGTLFDNQEADDPYEQQQNLFGMRVDF